MLPDRHSTSRFYITHIAIIVLFTTRLDATAQELPSPPRKSHFCQAWREFFTLHPREVL
jgi:hypothetical protein